MPLNTLNYNYNDVNNNYFSDKSFEQYDSFNLIDLEAIKKNYTILRNKHRKGCCGAVIKADSYGLGLDRVSQALFEVGCKDFFVFSSEEGDKLRKKYSSINIYIINTVLNELQECYEKNHFIPVLSDLEQVEKWHKLCKEKEKKLCAVIQFDTGMHRGGLDSYETSVLFDKPELTTNFKIKYIMSHLACAESKDNHMNFYQNNEFKKIINHFGNVQATLANSGGIFLGTDFHYDLLRPGISLYGLSPTPYETKNPMHPVLQTYARIMQFHSIKKGESIGYAQSYVATTNKRIAIVSIGYSNGYPYGLNGRERWCYIKNWKIPIIGQISMNALIIDVTNIPSANIHVGDLAELIGPNIKIEEVSEQTGTITREILCRLGAGTKKIYIG